MGLARNLSKFKPTSDGLVGAEDIAEGAVTADKLGFTLSSNALSQAMPLKSGATLTAGRAVNINTSGEVGDYPVANTLGTLVTTTVGPYEGNNTWSSPNGTRVLKFAGGGSVTLQIQGYAITSTTTTAGTAVNWGASGASGGGWYSYSCYPINETQFLVGSVTSSNSSYEAQTLYWTFKVVTVDSSGNVTLGSAASFSQGSMGPWNGRAADIYPLPDGRFVIFCFSFDAQGYDQYYSRTATVSGTTITLTSDTDLRWYSNNTSYLLPNNKIIGPSGSTLYYCDYNGSTTSGYLNSSIVSNLRGSTGVESVLLNSTYGIVLCQKANNDIGIQTFSVNQTTAVPTLTNFTALTNSTSPMYNPKIAIVSSTEIAITYKLGTETYLNSVKLDATGNVIGKGIARSINVESDDISHLKPTSTPNVVRCFFNNSASKGNSRDITINSYDTFAWVGLGAVATSQTTSPATIVVSGVCGGFSGLNAGSNYYLDESTYTGTVTSTVGSILIGKAVSSTEILLG